MTYNTFNYLNDHIHIHIPSNTHKFLFFCFYFIFIFFGVAGIGRNFLGEVYVNLVVIQDQFSSSTSLHCLSMKLAGAEVTSTEILEFIRIQVNLLQITTTMLPLPIKSTHFNCCQAAVIIPSLHRNAHWNCLLLILNISKKLLSFITKKFWLYHIQYQSLVCLFLNSSQLLSFSSLNIWLSSG